MIKNISFCIFSYGHSDSSLKRCINSIRKQDVPRYEVLVCGTGSKQTDVVFYHQEDWARGGEINKMRNHLCSHASNEFIVLMDASIELSPNWYTNMMHADCYDLIGCHLSNPDGERVVDWAYPFKLKDDNIPLPLIYDEWSINAYVSGILTVVRRNVWEKVKFDENLLLNQDDDLDFCIRVSKIGYRIGVSPDATTVYHFDGSAFKNRKYITFKDSLKIVGDYRHAINAGKIEYNRKNYDGAIKYYNQILKIVPDNASTLTDLGWAHYYKGQYDKAISAFNNAIRLDEKNNRALCGRGWATLQKSDHNNAIGDLSKAIECTNPTDKSSRQEVFRGLGWAYYHKGDFNEAIRYFDKAIENIDSKENAILNEVLHGIDMARIGKRIVLIKVFLSIKYNIRFILIRIKQKLKNMYEQL